MKENISSIVRRVVSMPREAFCPMAMQEMEWMSLMYLEYECLEDIPIVKDFVGG